MISLSGRNVVVTGAAQGVGRGIAALLAASGAQVALLDVSSDGLALAVEELRPTGRVFGVVADVSDPSDLERAREEVNRLIGGPVDTLEHQLQRETELQLADHHDGRLAAAESHQVAAVDLALDLESQPLEEALHGLIERRLQSESFVHERAKLLRAV